jgi:hypothetical protein
MTETVTIGRRPSPLDGDLPSPRRQPVGISEAP